MQPVVEVLPELAVFDERRTGFLCVALMMRTSTGVFLRRADLAHLLFLDRAQQLHLHRERQVGDFVEEQRAAVGGLEESVAIGLGAGERALAVAEELALHQVLGNRAAVHRDERLLGARTASDGSSAPRAPCRCRIRR